VDSTMNKNGDTRCT